LSEGGKEGRRKYKKEWVPGNHARQSVYRRSSAATHLDNEPRSVCLAPDENDGPLRAPAQALHLLKLLLRDRERDAVLTFWTDRRGRVGGERRARKARDERGCGRGIRTGTSCEGGGCHSPWRDIPPPTTRDPRLSRGARCACGGRVPFSVFILALQLISQVSQPVA